MTRTTHTVLRHATGENPENMHRVTLPAIPGVIIDNDRSDTAPTLATIRYHRPSRALYGAAARAATADRARAFIAALAEAAAERAEL